MIKAAVILPLVEESKILFIKRNKDLKVHSGEISFPGGKFDLKFDKDFKDTALREFEEEVGIKRTSIKIIGELPPEPTFQTNFLVYTFIGKILSLNTLKIDKKEVEKILIIDIEHLINPKNKIKVPLKINGTYYYNTFYYYENHLIWGATSRILDKFLIEFYEKQ